jgi:glycosyltransferase involved in cell wall biosynthesis
MRASAGKKPLSIALYLPNLAGGGAERTFLLLGRELGSHGYAVVVVVDRMEGALIKSFAEYGIRVEALQAIRTIAALSRLARWLRRNEPDVLISAITLNNIIALWARRLARVRTRIIVCEHTVPSRQSSTRAAWQYRLVPWLLRNFYHWADAILAVSAGVADDIAALSRVARETIRVIPNPVVTPDFETRAAAAVDHGWLTDRSFSVFVAAGRLVPLKGFDTLLNAFDQVQRRCPARLIIIGEGPLRETLTLLRDRLKLQETVDLPGFIDDPLPVFARAAVVVVSSVYEGFGLTLVEAMACGTPVVSTDCPTGPREILDNGRFGPLVPVNDAGRLAEAMLSALNSPIPPERLKARAAEYAVDKIGLRYRALIEELLSGRGSPR